jgi:hypothetical protein
LRLHHDSLDANIATLAHIISEVIVAVEACNGNASNGIDSQRTPAAASHASP